MPRFDGTGPQGQGPMTGWGKGMCHPNSATNGPYTYPQPGTMGSAYGPVSGWDVGFSGGRRPGRGAGFRCGRGRGVGRRWF